MVQFGAALAFFSHQELGKPPVSVGGLAAVPLEEMEVPYAGRAYDEERSPQYVLRDQGYRARLRGQGPNVPQSA